MLSAAFIILHDRALDADRRTMEGRTSEDDPLPTYLEDFLLALDMGPEVEVEVDESVAVTDVESAQAQIIQMSAFVNTVNAQMGGED